jgi:predicted ribosomally synthesized peptide with nif11-like leader
MSVESAKAFVERIKSDEEFANTFREFKNIEEAQRHIAALGYDFTIAELEVAQGDLLDEDLARVAGGLLGRCTRKHF